MGHSHAQHEHVESAGNAALRCGRLRWIALDGVGTLIEPAPPAPVVYAEVARAHGSRRTVDEIAQRFRTVWHRCEQTEVPPASEWGHADRLRTSEAHERQRWRRIVAQVIDDIDDPEAAFDELFAHFANPGSWRCFADVGPALQRLRDAGYRLAVASNFDDRLLHIVAAMPELNAIERTVVSSRVGYRKPSALFFRALLEATGCEADEILVVGDDQRNDIDGATRAGIGAVWLRRGRPPQSDLQLESLSQLPARLC